MASKGALFIMVLVSLFGTHSNPRGETILKDVKVCESETATLACETDAQKPSYRWRFASRKRVPVKSDKYEQLTNGRILLVKDVDYSDVARIKYISCHTHSKDMRKIVYLYKIKINCENLHTPVLSTVRLPCKVNVPDDELDFIKWTFIFKRYSKTERIKLFRKDGKTTLASSLKFNGRVSVKNRTLIIQTIKMEDAGTYHCVAHDKKHFHQSAFHYNVNVTARTTTKPIAMSTILSAKTTTLNPNIAHTVEPAKIVALNYSSQPQLTMAPTRKTGNISTGVMQLSTTPTAPFKTQSSQNSMVQTNTRSTVLTTKTPKPTTAFLPNKDSSKLNNRFTTKPRDLLPTTSYTVNVNESQKPDERTPNRSTRSAPSQLLFMFLFFNLVNSQLNNVCTS